MPSGPSLRPPTDLQFPILSLDIETHHNRTATLPAEMEYESTLEDHSQEGPADDNFEVISHPDHVYSSDDESLSSYRPSETGTDSWPDDSGRGVDRHASRLTFPTMSDSEDALDSSELTACLLRQSLSSYEHLNMSTIAIDSLSVSTKSASTIDVRDQPQRLALDRPIQIMFHGPREAKAVVTEKIAQAIAWSAMHDRQVSRDANRLVSRVNIVRLPQLHDHPASPQVTIIPSTGLEMDVLDCDLCEAYFSACEKETECRLANSLCPVRHGHPETTERNDLLCQDLCHQGLYCKQHKNMKRKTQQAHIDLTIVMHNLHDFDETYGGCSVPCSVNFASTLAWSPVLNLVQNPTPTEIITASERIGMWRSRLKSADPNSQVIIMDDFLDMPNSDLCHQIVDITGLDKKNKSACRELFAQLIQEIKTDKFGLIRLALGTILLFLACWGMVGLAVMMNDSPAHMGVRHSVSTFSFGQAFAPSHPTVYATAERCVATTPRSSMPSIAKSTTPQIMTISNLPAESIFKKDDGFMAPSMSFDRHALQDWLQFPVEELLLVAGKMYQMIHRLVAQAEHSWHVYQEAFISWTGQLRDEKAEQARRLTHQASRFSSKSYAALAARGSGARRQFLATFHDEEGGLSQTARTWYQKAKSNACRVVAMGATKRSRLCSSPA